MKFLVTAFGPFQGETLNPSMEVAQAISAESGVDVLILPVAFVRVFELVKLKIEENTYDFIISLGQAGGRRLVGMERIAINLIDTDIPDEEGALCEERKIQDLGPAAYISPLPLRAWQKKISTLKNLPVEVSNSAGLFVCNYLYYQLQHYLQMHSAMARCLFVHLPYMTQQTLGKPSGTPSLEISVMRDCVAEIMKQCRTPS